MNPYRYVPLGNDVYVDRFGPEPPNRTKPLAAAISLVLLVMVVHSVYALVMDERNKCYRVSCESNLKQLGLAFMQYAQDYDEHFPRVTGASEAHPYTYPAYGWADALMPYLESERTWHCPTIGHPPTHRPMERGYTDYWFNRHLSGIASAKVYNISSVLVCGDGNDGTDQTDARYSLAALPTAWLNDATKPPYRHLDTAAYLFGDGHVESSQAHSISLNPECYPTFAVMKPPAKGTH